MNKYLALWNVIKKQEKPIRFMVAHFLVKLGLSRLFTIQRNGYKLRFYPSNISTTLWIYPDVFPEVEFFKDYLREGDVVIDIGSNVGTTSIPISQVVGNSGQVYSIEAHPRIYKYQKKNIKLNDIHNIWIFNLALGNEIGQVVFDDSRADDQNAVSVNLEGIKVPMTRLDDFPVYMREKIALIKIDVEGYEKFIIEGGKEILKKTDCVYFESIDKHFEKYGYTSRDVINLLENYGFKIYNPKTLSLIPKNYASSKLEKNLLAVRSIKNFFKRMQ